MFVHAEKKEEDPGTLKDGDLSLFMRIGSDYRNNYYEIEIPLHLTAEGHYNNQITSDREKVYFRSECSELTFRWSCLQVLS